jgi:esterase/lipase
MNNTTITMSIHKRYEYTKIVIESILDSMDYCGLNLPILFSIDYHDDKIVDLKATNLFIAGIDKDYVTFKKYENSKHDILNDTCRNEAFKEIISFIESNI